MYVYIYYLFLHVHTRVHMRNACYACIERQTRFLQYLCIPWYTYINVHVFIYIHMSKQALTYIYTNKSLCVDLCRYPSPYLHAHLCFICACGFRRLLHRGCSLLHVIAFLLRLPHACRRNVYNHTCRPNLTTAWLLANWLAWSAFTCSDCVCCIWMRYDNTSEIHMYSWACG